MHEQGSQEWLDERKNKLTASTIAVLEDKHHTLQRKSLSDKRYATSVVVRTSLKSFRQWSMELLWSRLLVTT